MDKMKFDKGINLILCDGPLHRVNLVDDFKILFSHTLDIKTVKSLKKFINLNNKLLDEKPFLIITHLKSFEKYFKENNVKYKLFKCGRFYFQPNGNVSGHQTYKLYYVFHSIQNKNILDDEEIYFKFSKEEFRTLIREAKLDNILGD